MSGDDRFADLGARPPEDPLADLGGDDRPAGERLAELDERRPEPREEPPPPPRPSSRYAWVVGIVFLIAIVFASINAIESEGPGVLGLEPGSELPLFAAPLATTGPDRDANVDEEEVCSLRLPDVVNICRLRDEPLVISFMFTRFADCAPQLDRMERLREDFPAVTFVGVIVREPKDDAAQIVRDHGWDFPVALDRDGLVSNVYGIGGCPTTVFARRGGVVEDTRVGELGVAELRGELRAIVPGGAR